MYKNTVIIESCYMKDRNLLEYLEKNNFEKHLKYVKKKLQNKSIIIYGAGILFEIIKANYNLSGLNIVGISDRKFSENQEGQDFLGYKIIPFSKIIDIKPDYVLVSVLRFLDIVEDFEENEFKGTKIKIRPLIKAPLIELLKEIWCE